MMLSFHRALLFRKRGVQLNTLKKENTKRLIKNMHPAQKILRAIKIAEIKAPPKMATSAPVEELGIMLRLIRKRKGERLDEFSARINVSPENLFALEAGILPSEKLFELLPFVLKGIGIPPEMVVEELKKENKTH